MFPMSLRRSGLSEHPCSEHPCVICVFSRSGCQARVLFVHGTPLGEGVWGRWLGAPLQCLAIEVMVKKSIKPMVFQQFCLPYHRQSTPRALPDDAWSEIVVRRDRPALQRSRSSFLSSTTKISLQLRGQLDNDLARNWLWCLITTSITTRANFI